MELSKAIVQSIAEIEIRWLALSDTAVSGKLGFSNLDCG